MRVSIIRGVSFFNNKTRVTYFFRLAEVTDVSVSIRTAAHKNLSHTSISYCRRGNYAFRSLHRFFFFFCGEFIEFHIYYLKIY